MRLGAYGIEYKGRNQLIDCQNNLLISFVDQLSIIRKENWQVVKLVDLAN
jgi:hypothetical protein